MKIELTDDAVEWFKDELELPEEGKVLQFYVRYGGEFQLKQGFSPAFNVEFESDIDEIGFEETFNDIRIVIAEKDVWYYGDHKLSIDINDDEVIYTAESIEA
ncbi:HesB/YadR/YfhF family protein [Staphylococcus pseudintermedius]|uniref:HesB/YadR/YfhF family protein n=1 Tax=Staphylococcus pseudintermedius TaxID=283734 RepID=UPI0023B1BA76|nr:hypothetical protein [Staphylococcus pseudintermedius]EIS6531756.1 hypothetical protein [Staphylococcus pseudintermedius]ELV2647711.1 hypothetical protein [Staphylococcus pseudintermedius]ELV3392728.1 hypothetical protein [Staphylococcus pseudintermedius]MDE9953967.1 hypothetical protein [Staphylococcus pseudintermedius]MDE9956038.1 hypothetical protein [Staphylococcus pseudintermedius]